MDEARARHADLVREIRNHDQAYYVQARPTISDADYDRLYRALLDLERAFPDLITDESPSQRVGGAPSEGFARVTHEVPMLSLEKVETSRQPAEAEVPDREARNRLQDERTLVELRAFDHGIRQLLGEAVIDYLMEPKVDGVSITVHYREGRLEFGATRGDGLQGDDITANLRTLRSIPLQLATPHPPAWLEVRGEAYMTSADFEALNAQLRAAGQPALPNARNATAGTLKLLDPRLVARRPLRAVFYAVGKCEGIGFAKRSELLATLEGFGLPVQREWWRCRGIDAVLDQYREKVVNHYDETADLRSRLPYEIDGIVLKLDDLRQAARIPAKRRAPGDAIVHKPIPWITPAETVLKAITVQVGRTGVLTPVAELEPVFVQGSTIARATLHNEDEIRRKDIRIGDTVVIRKAGMVIPEVFEVVRRKRPPGAVEFDLLKHVDHVCPACGGPIAKEKVSEGEADEVAWRCQNVAGCPAQQVRRLEYFAQRKALDIEALGGIVAEKLIESGLVREPLDLFELTLEPLARLNLGTAAEPRMFGEKNAAKVLAALERARALPLARWILALGIPSVGEATAYYLGQWHVSLKDVARSKLLALVRDERENRTPDRTRTTDDTPDGAIPDPGLPSEAEPSTRASRRRSHLALVAAEIDRRAASNNRLRTEVEKARTALSVEIRELERKLAATLAELEDLSRRADAKQPPVSAQLKKRRRERDGLKSRLNAREERRLKAGVPDELGPVVAASMLDYLESAAGEALLERLAALGIDPQGELAPREAAPSDGETAVAGRTFVITGTLSSLSRDEAFQRIRDAGGRVSSTVSGSTDYVVAGDNPGSKLEQARSRGVRVLSEPEFLQFLGIDGRVPPPPTPEQGTLF